MPVEMLPHCSKFAELLLYVSKKSEADPNFGATKLNKLLFYADFCAFAKMGRSISGQIYRKQEFGPTPVDLIPVREQLRTNREAEIQKRDHFGKMQDRLIALREPVLRDFSGEEIAIVDDILEKLRDKNATDVSELSHRFVGWQLARDGEEIPYETVFIADRPLSEKESAHALTLKSPLHP